MPSIEDKYDDSSIMNTDEEGGKQYEDGSYEQMVHNNSNPNVSPAELEQLLEDEIKTRNEMAMESRKILLSRRLAQ